MGENFPLIVSDQGPEGSRMVINRSAVADIIPLDRESFPYVTVRWAERFDGMNLPDCCHKAFLTLQMHGRNPHVIGPGFTMRTADRW